MARHFWDSMKTRTFIAIAVCFAVLAFALSLSVVKAPPTRNGRLQGVVTDAVTSLPIFNATVFIDANRLTHTAADGSYSFGSVPVGVYPLTASQTGYATQIVSVTISSGATTTQDFALVPPLNTVPEVPLGTFTVSLVMLGIVAGYIAIPKLRKKK